MIPVCACVYHVGSLAAFALWMCEAMNSKWEEEVVLEVLVVISGGLYSCNGDDLEFRPVQNRRPYQLSPIGPAGALL